MLRRVARPAAALAAMAVLVAACGPGASGSARATAACGRPFRPGLQHDLQNVTAIVRKTYQIPGIAVAVTVPGEGCWTGVTGLANTARHVPLTLDDAFPIGSIAQIAVPGGLR